MYLVINNLVVLFRYIHRKNPRDSGMNFAVTVDYVKLRDIKILKSLKSVYIESISTVQEQRVTTANIPIWTALNRPSLEQR